MTLFLSFSWLSTIPCVCVCVCVWHFDPFVSRWMFTLFPRLGYCNSAALNIGVCVSFWITVLSRYMPRVGLLVKWELCFQFSEDPSYCCSLFLFSRTVLSNFFVTPRTVAHQALPSVHGIFQPRILEWVAISFSKGSSWPRDWTCVSCICRRIVYQGATWEASVFP